MVICCIVWLFNMYLICYSKSPCAVPRMILEAAVRSAPSSRVLGRDGDGAPAGRAAARSETPANAREKWWRHGLFPGVDTAQAAPPEHAGGRGSR